MRHVDLKSAHISEATVLDATMIRALLAEKDKGRLLVGVVQNFESTRPGGDDEDGSDDKALEAKHTDLVALYPDSDVAPKTLATVDFFVSTPARERGGSAATRRGRGDAAGSRRGRGDAAGSRPGRVEHPAARLRRRRVWERATRRSTSSPSTPRRRTRSSAARIFCGRVAAPPRLGRGYSVEMSAARTRQFARLRYVLLRRHSANASTPVAVVVRLAKGGGKTCSATKYVATLQIEKKGTLSLNSYSSWMAYVFGSRSPRGRTADDVAATPRPRRGYSADAFAADLPCRRSDAAAAT